MPLFGPYAPDGQLLVSSDDDVDALCIGVIGYSFSSRWALEGVADRRGVIRTAGNACSLPQDTFFSYSLLSKNKKKSSGDVNLYHLNACSSRSQAGEGYIRLAVYCITYFLGLCIEHRVGRGRRKIEQEGPEPFHWTPLAAPAYRSQHHRQAARPATIHVQVQHTWLLALLDWIGANESANKCSWFDAN